MFKFLRPIQRYFFPPRKLHRIPKHISAEYARHDIENHQRLVMMAGLARDPARASEIYKKMCEEYGVDETRQRLELQVKRNRPGSFSERLLKLFRRIFGEHDRILQRSVQEDARVKIDYRYRQTGIHPDNGYQKTR